MLKFIPVLLMLPGILACNQRPGSNRFVIDRIPRPIIVKTWKLALDKLSVQQKGTVGGNSEQVIEKEQISAADDRDIIEAALQEITIDKVGGNSEQVIEKEQISAADHRDIIEGALEEIEVDRNNVAKYIPVGAHSAQVIEKEQNSAQTYRLD